MEAFLLAGVWGQGIESNGMRTHTMHRIGGGLQVCPGFFECAPQVVKGRGLERETGRDLPVGLEPKIKQRIKPVRNKYSTCLTAARASLTLPRWK